MNNLDFNYFCRLCPHDEAYRRANCFVNYRVKRFKAGESVAHRGETARELSILVEGSVVTELVLESGIAYTTQKHNAPYPMGALALFADDNSYRADFVALDDATFISVSRDEVEEHIAKCRLFMRNFIAYNTSKIDLFAKHLSILTHRTLKARLALYILSRTKGLEFSFDKRLEPLATYLGVERPSLSRAISQLVDEGIISYRRGEGQILKFEELRLLLL